MSTNYLNFTFVFIGLLFFNANFAQPKKKFTATIKWPKEMVAEKFEIFVENGLETKTIVPKSTEHQIIISDNYVSQYVTISIVINSKNKLLPAYSQFYISRKPATIILNSKLNLPKDQGLSFKTTNAIDVNQNIKEYNAAMKPLKDEYEEYVVKNGVDSTYYSIYNKFILKQLDFVKDNIKSYFAFKIFQYHIAPVQFPFQDSLLDSFLNFYTVNFPLEIQKSHEGKSVKKLLESKWISRHDGIKAPEFTITDILGNKTSLQDLKNKYILINFWATWCGPCMAEIPAIKKIKDEYSKNDLIVISVSFDKNYKLFLEAIEKNNMDWINVYQDEKIASSFGGRNMLPQLFLIDNTGNIIYNRSSGKEVDYVNLKTLNEMLEKKLGK